MRWLQLSLDVDDGRGDQLVDLMLNIGFGCINDPTKPTFHASNGTSVIDLVFASPTLTNNLKLHVLNSNVTKHNLVVTQIASSNDKWQIKKTSLRKMDPSLLAIAFNDMDFCNSESDVSEYANSICKLLHDCKVQQKPRKSKPWFNGQLYELHQNWRNFDKIMPPNRPIWKLSINELFDMLSNNSLKRKRNALYLQLKTIKGNSGIFSKFAKEPPHRTQ